MKDNDSRIERLISLAERIITALEGRHRRLKEGRTGALSTNDPEIQKLTALYGREAKSFDLRSPRIGAALPCASASSPSPPNSAKCCSCMPA